MLDYFVTDVFTDRPFTGNPLAIVTGADDLTTLQMQTLARQFNLSETIFVQTPDNPDHVAKVRIFFPTDEIPFAGHPTIGCAIHLATAAHTGDFESQLVLEEVAGLVPVTVSRRDSVTRAELTAPILPEPTDGHVERDLIATAINLAPEDFARDTAAVHAGGPAFLYIEVASPDALRRAAPHEPAWQHLTETAGVDAAYL